MLILGHQACPWETINLCRQSGVPSNADLNQDQLNEICNIIIDICIDNRPFKVFINRMEEGVGDLKCGDVGETNRLEDVANEHGVNKVSMK